MESGSAGQTRGLKAGFLNATSLKKHIWQFRQSLICDSSYHIFGVAETRLGPEVDDCHVEVPGYSVLRQDRNLGGGGIILYIKNNLKAKVLHTSKTTQRGKPLKTEYIFCAVWEGHSSPTLVVLVYRPPDVPLRPVKQADTSLDVPTPSDRQLVKLLRSACSDYSRKIIMGDWNADMSDPKSSDAKFVRELMAELSLKLVNTGPSHHTTHSDTWIDILLTDECDSIMEYHRTSPTFPSGHDVISVTINVFQPIQPAISHTYRNIRKIKSDDLCTSLLSCDWSAFVLPTSEFNIEQGLAKLTDNLQEAMDKLAPEKTVNHRKHAPPWINTEIRLLTSERDATCRRYHRTGSRQLLRKFFDLANAVEEQTENARCAHMHNCISDALDSGKNFWKEMRNLGLIPKASDALHGFMPDELNAHFSNIAISASENAAESYENLANAPSEGFCFTEVSDNDVILAVSHFKSQARGDDGIPQSVIAKALPTITPYLTKLFNASLSQGIFPSSWKKARILALKKSSVPSSPSDFRPISLLCFLSKVLEKLAHDQVMGYLNSLNILDPFQTGFRKYHSTQSALLKLTDDIRVGKSKKLATLLLQFDFSKAFDTISPSKLLIKLRSLGFSKSALHWFWSYLTGRSQCVFSQSSSSDYCDINLGVPQGSVLGPLLFCLYINDLKDLLGGKDVLRLLYADDLQIYVQIPAHQIEQGINLLSEASRIVAAWAKLNFLTLNAKKTKAIVFGTSHTVKLFRDLQIQKITINDDGDQTDFVDEVVSLGVTLDSTLSWEPQVNQVTKKVNKSLFGLRFIQPCTTLALRKRLVESLVLPHLDYCTVVYHDASSLLRTRLQRLANAGVRYIFGLRRDTHITPYRKQLGWQRNDSRREYFALLILYRIVEMKEPPILLSLFNPYRPARPRRGPRQDLETPTAPSNTFQTKFANMWNSLPLNLRDLPSYSRFKRGIRRYLLDLDA